MKATSLYVQTIATSWASDLELWTPESTIFHGFGSRGWICAGISSEPYKLWTWDLHHWIQQRLRFKSMCRNIVTTPSYLELWAPEFNHITWIWFVWVNLCWHISWNLQAISKDKSLAWTVFGTVGAKFCFSKPSDMAISLHWSCFLSWHDDNSYSYPGLSWPTITRQIHDPISMHTDHNFSAARCFSKN